MLGESPFWPLPSLQRTASGVSRSTHGEGSGHPGPPTRHFVLTPSGDPPGAPPGELHSLSSWARQEYSNRLDADILRDIDDLPTPPMETTPVAPLQIQRAFCRFKTGLGSRLSDPRVGVGVGHSHDLRAEKDEMCFGHSRTLFGHRV